MQIPTVKTQLAGHLTPDKSGLPVKFPAPKSTWTVNPALETESYGLEALKVIITAVMPFASGTKFGLYEILSPFSPAGRGQYGAAPERPSR